MEEIVEADAVAGFEGVPIAGTQLDRAAPDAHTQSRFAVHTANRQFTGVAHQECGLVEKRWATQLPTRDDEAQWRTDVRLGQAQLAHQLGIEDVAAIPRDSRPPPCADPGETSRYIWLVFVAGCWSDVGSLFLFYRSLVLFAVGFCYLCVLVGCLLVGCYLLVEVLCQ